MRLRKTLLSLTALAALVPTVALSAPAQAQTASRVSCAGEVCVEYSGSKNGFYAVTHGFGFYGHVDLWGPGVSFRHSPDMQDPGVGANGIGAGWLCAHGWKHENGNFIDMGFPCVEVPA
ncbi:hypothetical protein [Streptosporangium carneum]|uniref:Uncharacterized protein n=1 Tax=Streptosporangium carneum TaxID=47481 RepID=A0A9W6I589_9ACTN|nr:hypothetical protein [Streptosporangium carneum]GLK12271.1 hypothetical protein GCM10017600_56800 [Streptosporangium carneum]